MNASKSLKLSTQNLELIAATLDHLHTELEMPDKLSLLLNAQVGPGWPPGEYDRNAQEFFRDRMIEGGECVSGWYCWYAIKPENRNNQAVLVGACGYFGPPNEAGEVEIGFSVMPLWQSLGYATEMAEKLVENAFTERRVQKVIAHAQPENIASCRVMEKCGFSHTGIDVESGNIQYELRR